MFKKQKNLRKEFLKDNKKTHYSVKKNIERIANSLQSIACTLAAISIHQDKDKQIVLGLSAICKNAYSENIRTQEIIDLIKRFFPEDDIERVEGKKE